jgi:diaminopimelate decarboxylase
MLTRDSDGRALVAGRSIATILDAVDAATPAYVYDLGAMAAEARELIAAFGDQANLVAFAIKANSAGSVIRTLANVGCGAEVGSHAELEVARRTGIGADRILMSGMGKTAQAVDAAIGCGDRGIRAIQIDSVDEIARVAARARALGRAARVSFRVNPAVRADTHDKIATGHEDAKFGIAMADLDAAWHALEEAGSSLVFVGFGVHVGSQLTDTGAYLEAADALLALTADRERTIGGKLEMIDFGGGFGVDYGDGCVARPAQFVRAAVQRVVAAGMGHCTVAVEPGRSLVAPHGALIARVVATKITGERRFLVIDAGMNDLLRPALYGARHRVEPVDSAPVPDAPSWRVVGPVCESSCDFGEHAFADPAPTEVVIRDAGAYGFAMANNYNGRGLPTEVFVHEDGRITKSTAGSTGWWIEQRSGA